MTGGFNQQVMLGMQHSAMITNQYGGYAPNPSVQPVPTQGQNFANLMTMAGGQRGMQALDSLSSVPILGGIASGFGQMGLGQMMYGAQQQQMLQSNLQQSFQFRNQQGGRGFTQAQMGGIGSQLREMSLERGPAGEQVSFEELGRLASNMGRMGLAQNVRSVKDFNEKFKEMLSTVKTVAEEMGTSLEEAQKTMVAMKGAGVFRHQGEVAQMMRQGALAGNLGMSELSAAAQMGSHFSRSMGGRGRSGAVAGIQAISQLGAAQQAGVINEEDIYNVTGMTGAEGRQAMVQRQLSFSQQFWRSNIGRRALASMAEQGGQINEADARALAAGGGFSRQGLQRTGRADFIRNEGRLRGEAMRTLGANAPMQILAGELERRGIDTGSDRARLFLQRRLRMSRDDADVMLKQIEGLESTKMQERMSREEDDFSKEMDIAQRKASPAEIVKKFEDAREKVNAKIRQFGADVNSQTAAFLDNVMKRITKNYEMQVDRTIAPAVRALRTGDISAGTMAREFGLDRMGDLEGKTRGTLGGQMGELTKGFGLDEGGDASAMQISNLVSANYDQLRRAGMKREDIRNITTVEQLDEAQRTLVEKGQGGLRGMLHRESQFATAEARQFALGSLAAGGARGVSMDDLNVLADPLTQASLFAGGKESKAGKFIQDIESFTTENIFNPLKNIQEKGLRNARDIASAPRRGLEAVGRGITDLVGEETITDIFGEGFGERVSGMLGDVLGEAEERGTGVIEAFFGGASIAERTATGEFLEKGQGKEMLKTLFRGTAEDRAGLRTRTREQIQELEKKEDLTEEEKGRLQGLKSVRAAQELAEWRQKNKRDPTPEEIEEIAEKAGVEPGELLGKAAAAGKAAKEGEESRRKQAVEFSRRAAQKELSKVRDRLKAGREGIKDLSPEAAAYLEGMEADLEKQATVTMGAKEGDVEGAFRAIEAAGIGMERRRERKLDELKGLSVEDKRKRLKEMREGGLEGVAEVGEERVALEQKFARGARMGGGGLGVTREMGRALGVSMSRKDLRGLRGKDPEAAIEMIMERSGVEDLESEGAEVAKKDIRKRLTDVSKAETPEEKAKLMQELRQKHGGTFAEARREQQEKKSEAEDPSFRKLGEIKDAIADQQKAVVTAVNTVADRMEKAVSEGGGLININTK